MIKGLHHNAYRCRDSEETRRFYEDFLGLPLVNAFEITETKTGRDTHVLHSFYAMDDGSCLAFFEAPASRSSSRCSTTTISTSRVEVAREALEPMLAKAQRGWHRDAAASPITQFIDSIYLRDPNGYVIELTAKRPDHDALMDPATNHARAHLDTWQRDKRTYGSK